MRLTSLTVICFSMFLVACSENDQAANVQKNAFDDLLPALHQQGIENEKIRAKFEKARLEYQEKRDYLR